MTDDPNYYQRVSDYVARTRGDLPHHERHFPRPPGRIRRVFVTAVLILAALTAMTYVCDYLVVRYRIAANRNPYGSVNVDLIYAIPEKGNRTEFRYGGTQAETCIHALFPHLGYTPCWYLRRHTDKRIDF